MKQIKEWLMIIGVVTLIIGGIGSLCYLDFTAYKARFPNAPTWTYFFQGRK